MADMSTTQNTNPHRPSAIIPSDYRDLGAFYQGSSEAEWKIYNAYEHRHTYAQVEATGLVADGGDWGSYVDDPSVFHQGHYAKSASCDSCGATFAHGELYLHLPTNTLVAFGHTCASNMGLDTAARAAKAERTRILNQAYREVWLEEDPTTYAWLMEAPQGGGFASDLRRRFQSSKPELSFKQSQWAHKLARQAAEWQGANAELIRELEAAPEGSKLAELHWSYLGSGSLSEKATAWAWELVNAEPEPEAQPVPAGKGVEVTGKVIKTDWHENDFGDRKVMTVKTDAGWLVWGTVPSAIYSVQAGDTVTFVANLEASDRDPSFGFFKRPRKAELLEEV